MQNVCLLRMFLYKVLYKEVSHLVSLFRCRFVCAHILSEEITSDIFIDELFLPQKEKEMMMTVVQSYMSSKWMFETQDLEEA